MTPDAVALARVPALFEFGVDPPDVNEMLSVECANGTKRRTAVLLDESVLPRLLQQLPGRFQTQSQSRSVQTLETLQLVLTLAQRPSQSLVLPDHLLGSSVKTEVDQLSSDVDSQLFRLVLSLLPTGADDGQRLPASERVERRREIRLEALRTQQDDASHGTP